MAKILVCDDEGPRAASVLQRLKRRLDGMFDYEVVAVPPGDFIEAVAGLEKRQLEARETTEKGWPTGQGNDLTGHLFDDVDILFLDYDLLRLRSSEKSSIGADTGERVCYLARCYSACGTIVAYNQFSYRATFDLSLRGHIRSYADLNISMDLAANAGLWGDDYTGFRPWHWPLLSSSHEQLNRRVAAIAHDLNAPILATLGLDGDETYELFTREQLEFLSPKADPRHATFMDFVRDSVMGLRPRDLPLGLQSVARIAAARIWKWLERAVLPDQHILVDAPHLISRFPSLVGEPFTEERFDAACRLAVPRQDLGIETGQIREYQFPATDWVSRPAWLWPRLAADSNIPEVKDPWTAHDSGLVFCEDVSRFRPRRIATEFDADVSPEFGLRYIQKVKNIDYVPTVRLLV